MPGVAASRYALERLRIMWKLVLIVMVAALASGCIAPITPVAQMESRAATAQACEDAGGKYLPFFNECEEISAAACTAMDGVFDECASACRHLPEGVMCTMQCVPLCTFGGAESSGQPQSVIAQLNGSLECNLMDAPRDIGEVTAYYICQAPGAYLTFVDVRTDPWTAGYFTTDSQSTQVTYGPEQVTVEPNPGAP